MYGSVFTMQPRKGKEEALKAIFDEWVRERRPKVKGFVATYVFRPDNRPNTLIGVAIFSDRAAYRANADDPEQDKWYRRMRELLVADPKWEDGEVVSALSG
jgi:quinol monooxygenase YgiN